MLGEGNWRTSISLTLGKKERRGVVNGVDVPLPVLLSLKVPDNDGDAALHTDILSFLRHPQPVAVQSV